MEDYWVVKLDSSGLIQWQKSYGGTNNDAARQIQQTMDGGFILSGYTLSNNIDVSGNHGSEDYWVVKLASITSINLADRKTYFNLYPNPTSRSIQLEVSEGELDQIKIIGVLDNRLISVDNYVNGNQKNIDVSTLPEGIYFVQIKTAEGILTKKIIVRR